MDLDLVLRRQQGLLRRDQALAAGLTPSALRHRLRPGGPWQTVVPGVCACFTGTLTAEQRHVAAPLHAGAGAQLAGATVLRRFGLHAVPEDGCVHVLVPHRRRPGSAGFVVVHRSSAVPRPVSLDGLPGSPLPRAVVDAARALSGLRAVRAAVAEPVQRRLVTVEALADELASGPVRGSALLRAVLEEVRAGVRSPTEGELRQVLRRSPLLRDAVWDVRLVGTDGRWLADVDCWLEAAGLVVESDSRAWHLSPEHWERTMARHGRLTAAGVRVLHVPPSRHRRDPDGVRREVEAAYRAGRAGGGAPGVRATPLAA